MGWNNPAIPWSEFERALSDASRPGRAAGGRGRRRLPRLVAQAPRLRAPGGAARSRRRDRAVRGAARPLQLQLPRRREPARAPHRGGGAARPARPRGHRPRRPLRHRAHGGGRCSRAEHRGDGVRGRALPGTVRPAERRSRPGGQPPARARPARGGLPPARDGDHRGAAHRRREGPSDLRPRVARRARRRALADPHRLPQGRGAAGAGRWHRAPEPPVPSSTAWCSCSARRTSRSSCSTPATRSTTPATTRWPGSPHPGAFRWSPPGTCTTRPPRSTTSRPPSPRCAPAAASTRWTAGCPPAGVQHLRSGAEMAARFGRYPGAIENTVRFADECAFELRRARPGLPKQEVPDGHTPMSLPARAGLGRAWRLARSRPPRRTWPGSTASST